MSDTALDNFIDSVYGKGESYSYFIHAGEVDEIFAGVEFMEEENNTKSGSNDQENKDDEQMHGYGEETEDKQDDEQINGYGEEMEDKQEDKQDDEQIHGYGEETEENQDDKKNIDESSDQVIGTSEISIGSMSIKIGLAEEFTGGVSTNEIKMALTNC